MRKFADKQTKNRQTHVSKTEVHSIPLWILSGYTRELANRVGIPPNSLKDWLRNHSNQILVQNMETITIYSNHTDSNSC